MDDAPRHIRDPSWIKRAPRTDGQYQGLVVDSEGRLSPVTILDISSGGFKLEADKTFRIAEYIGLRISTYGEFSAQIRWAVAKEAGGIFLNPIVLPPR